MNQRGITLVELLIALAIFAVISASAVTLMSLSHAGRDRLETLNDEVLSLDQARAVIRQDLIQWVARPYRDPSAVDHLPPVLGGIAAEGQFNTGANEDRVVLAFVRRGWANPRYEQPRPSIQWVAYIIRGDTLVRRTRPFVDAALETPFRDQVLFSSVESVSLEFLNGSRWSETWISTTSVPAPAAVRLQMEHPVFGPITQLFLMGGNR